MARDLRQRRVLWLHGLCIGLITLAVTWSASAVQMHLGGESLALCAILFGAGALVLLYLDWEVLLAVAVELAFSYATARTAVRVTREDWASAAVRLTWKPLAGAVLCAVTLGATIDYFIPTAQSLPQALKDLTY